MHLCTFSRSIRANDLGKSLPLNVWGGGGYIIGANQAGKRARCLLNCISVTVDMKINEQNKWIGPVARWLVCHWGGKYTDCRPPPPPPPHLHTHTNTHAVFLSEFLISLQGRIQDFGEEGVGSTWIIDASTTGRGAREACENFCGARSNFSTDCIGN